LKVTAVRYEAILHIAVDNDRLLTSTLRQALASLKG
jgi:hypothetical protein